MYASGVCMHACMQKQAMHACVRPCTEQNGMSFMRMSTQVYVYCMFACGCLWRKTYISTYAYDRRYLWEHPYAHVHIGIFINVPVCVHIGLPPSPLFRALSWIDGSEPGPLPNFCCHALSVTVFSCGRLDSGGGWGGFCRGGKRSVADLNFFFCCWGGVVDSGALDSQRCGCPTSTQQGPRA